MITQRRLSPRIRNLFGVLLVLGGICAGPSHTVALPLNVHYADGLGEGFDDPVVGPARRIAFEYAVALWANTLGGDVPVTVQAAMDPLGGSGASALLASTASVTLHRNFPGVPAENVLYTAALANQLGGADINGELAEVDVIFNSDVDANVVLGSVDWYYGTDARPGNDIDLVTIALHELGHGFGFSDLVDQPSGQFFFGDPGIFDLQVMRPRVASLVAMLPAERRVALISGELFWDGPHVLAAHGSPAPLYAPDPFRRGTSVAHWDVSLSELLAPFYMGASHNPGLILPALVDMGWTLPDGATPLPSAEATSVPTATAAVIPTPTPLRPRLLAFVSNFDDDTVSVIEHSTSRVIDTVPVGDGPIGVAGDPERGLVYVANFRGGGVSVLDAERRAVIATVPTGGSPNSIVIPPRSRRAYVSDTFSDLVIAIDVDARAVANLIRAGSQPSAMALSPDGERVFVANFGDGTVSVIDPAHDLLRASIVVSGLDSLRRGLQSLALGPAGNGLVTAFHDRLALSLDSVGLTAGGLFLFTEDQDVVPDAVMIGADGSVAYVATHSATTGRGRLHIVDFPAGESRRVFSVGDVPEAMALSRDGAFLYVAGTGSGEVTVVRTDDNRITARVEVGASPMGVAVIALPAPCTGDCNGDRRLTVDELLTGVNIALGDTSLSSCPMFDADGSGSLTINDLIAAIRVALAGCPEHS